MPVTVDQLVTIGQLLIWCAVITLAATIWTAAAWACRTVENRRRIR